MKKIFIFFSILIITAIALAVAVSPILAKKDNKKDNKSSALATKTYNVIIDTNANGDIQTTNEAGRLVDWKKIKAKEVSLNNFVDVEIFKKTTAVSNSSTTAWAKYNTATNNEVIKIEKGAIYLDYKETDNSEQPSFNVNTPFSSGEYKVVLVYKKSM